MSLSYLRLLNVTLAILLLTNIWLLYQTLPYAPHQIDEDLWLSRTYFYDLYFHNKDFRNEDWSNPLSRDVPYVATYIYGAALDLGNNRTVNSSGGMMRWYSQSYKKILQDRVTAGMNKGNITALDGRRMLGFLQANIMVLKDTKPTNLDEADYLTGRRVGFAFAVGSILLILLLFKRYLQSSIGGYVACILFLNNVQTIPIFQQATVDSICCFFAIASVITLIELITRLDRSHAGGQKDALGGLLIVLMALAHGVAVGLAVGVKFTTLYLPPLTCAVFFAHLLLKKRRKHKKPSGTRATHAALITLGIFILTCLTAMSVFIAQNPLLWTSPVGGTIQMIEYKDQLMQIQHAVFREAIKTNAHRLDLIYRNGIMLGLRPPWAIEAAWLLLVMAGLVGLSRKTLHDVKAEKSFGAQTVVLVWLLAMVGITGWGMHMDWPRYYIPIVLASCILFSLGLDGLIRLILAEEPKSSR
jgi:hypothetical protein